MKNIIQKQLTHITTLSEASVKIVTLLEKVRSTSDIRRIGYVSGVVTSDGEEFVKRNKQRISRYARLIRKQQGIPIFSPVDIFSDRIVAQLDEYKLVHDEREHKIHLFWREILGSGHVTDIFMTPRWEISKGARDEFKTARKLGLSVHYVDTNGILLREVESKQAPEQTLITSAQG